MKPTDFPKFLAALDAVEAKHEASMAAHRAANPHRTFRPRDPNAPTYAERATKSIEEFSKGLEYDEILNARYLDAKENLNRRIDEAYRAVFTDPYLSMREQLNKAQEDALGEIYWISHPTLHSIPGMLKKVEKIRAKNPSIPMIGIVVDFLTELLPLAAAAKVLKDKVVKRQARSEEEKQAIMYTPPPSSAKAVAQVREMLEKFVADSYAALVAELEKRYQGSVSRFFDALEAVENGTSTRVREAHYRNRPFSPYEFCTTPYGVTSEVIGLQKFTTLGVRPNGQKGYVQVPNMNGVIHAEAVKDADHIKQMYIAKNLRKLTSILEAKGDDNFKDIREVGRPTQMAYLEGSMLIEFNDGSSFVASNSVVFVVNQQGTRFNRFPLTFHNVKLAGGVPMKAASEKRMNTVFVGKA